MSQFLTYPHVMLLDFTCCLTPLISCGTPNRDYRGSPPCWCYFSLFIHSAMSLSTSGEMVSSICRYSLGCPVVLCWRPRQNVSMSFCIGRWPQPSEGIGFKQFKAEASEKGEVGAIAGNSDLRQACHPSRRGLPARRGSLSFPVRQVGNR